MLADGAVPRRHGGGSVSGTPAEAPSGSGRRPSPRDIGYAEALDELEAILAELEREAVDVDHLAERVQRAAALIRLCRGRLASARIEVEAVVADLERAADDDGPNPPDGRLPRRPSAASAPAIGIADHGSHCDRRRRGCGGTRFRRPNGAGPTGNSIGIFGEPPVDDGGRLPTGAMTPAGEAGLPFRRGQGGARCPACGRLLPRRAPAPPAARRRSPGHRVPRPRRRG